MRHLQKLTKAAQTFLAKNALLHNQVRFLLRANNEAKVRRSAKALVLGQARVISFHDLEEARAERSKKEIAKENGKRATSKRGRKRKVDALDADISQPTAKIARVSEPPESEHYGETQGSESVLTSQPQRAPVARMW